MRTFSRLLPIVAAMLVAEAAAGASEKDYSDLFPQAMPGWTTGRVDADAIKNPLGGNLRLSRTYRNAAIKSEIKIVIDTNDCMKSALIEEAHGKNQLHQRPRDFSGYQAVEMGPEERPSGIRVDIASCKTVTINSAQGDASPDTMTQYLNAMDFTKIKRFEPEGSEDPFGLLQ